MGTQEVTGKIAVTHRIGARMCVMLSDAPHGVSERAQRGIAATKHAALCPKGRCHLGDTNALAIFAKKTNSSALVS